MAPAATTTTIQYEPLSFNDDLTDVKYTAVETQHHHHGPRASKDTVKEALKARVGSVNTDVCLAGEEDAFFVADMGHVYRQHMRWKKNLKRVKPHYGTSLMSTCLGEVMLIACKLSSATQTLRYSACSQHSAPASTVLPRQKSSKCSNLASSLLESYTRSRARRSRTFDSQQSKASNR